MHDSTCSSPGAGTGSFMFHLPLGSAEQATEFAHAVAVRSAGGGGAIELAFGTKSLAYLPGCFLVTRFAGWSM